MPPRSRSRPARPAVTREVDAGLETIEVDLPAVMTVDLRLNEPRYVKLPDIMKAKKKPLDVTSLDALGVSAAILLKTVKTEPPAQRQKGVMVKDVAELVDASQEERLDLMHKVLIVGEHDGKALNPATAKCVTCAMGIPDADITIVLLGDDTSKVAAQAAALAGVKFVVRVDRPENAHPLAAIFAPQLAALAAEYTHVFGPSTSFGKDLMPRVAALLGVAQVSDLMAVEAAYRFRRPIYAGNAIVTVEADASHKLIATVRVASFQAAASGGSGSIRVQGSHA